MDKGFLSASIVLVFLGVVLWVCERSKLTVKEIAVISVLAALAGLGRVPFAAIPSAQPTTFLVIISGYVFGCRAGFLVGIIATLVSNAFLGHGPWSVFQMLAWGLCGMTSGLFGKIMPRPSKKTFILFGFLWGYIFGLIMNMWYWVAFVFPLSWKTWILTMATSFWFDTTHAITNALFLGIMGCDFIQILKRFKQKLSFTYMAV